MSIRFMTILFFLSAMAGTFSRGAEPADSAVRVDAAGVATVDGLAFAFTHFGKGWKRMDVQSPQTVEFPAEAAPDGQPRTGTFRIGEAGAFAFRFRAEPGGADAVTCRYQFDADPPVDGEAMFLAASLPAQRFFEHPPVVNNRALRFEADYSPERWRLWGGRTEGPGTVALSLPRGRLVVTGDFRVELQDNRRYKQDTWSLRLHFRETPSWPLRQARMTVTFAYEPHPQATLDLRAAANRAFRDETPDDRQGGWTDQGAANDLAALPVGRQSFAGLTFDVIDPGTNGARACLALRGPQRPWLPTEGTALAHGARGRFLYVLNAVGWEPPRPTDVGTVRARYADGTEDVFPVKSGVDTGNFWTARRIERGLAAWTGRNESSDVVLYASRFALADKPLDRVAFVSGGGVVWMVVAATVTDAEFSPQAGRPVVMRADALWRPIDNPKPVAPGSVLDFSDLLDAPAGKYGFMRTRGGRFEFEDRPGVPARFWGINLCGDCNFPEPSEADGFMAELAAIGYNLIRLHHFEDLLVARAGGRSVAPDPEKLDRLERLVAAAKARGLYVTLDLFTNRRLEKGEIADFPDRAVTPREFKALIFLNDRARENYETLAARLLTHVNPHTGLAWKDDPVLVSISLVNEGTLSRTSVATPFIRDLYEQAFKAWLAERGLPDDERQQPVRYAQFLHDVYRRGHARLAGFVKGLGVRVLLTDLNYTNDLSTTVLRGELDYVDTHGYWAHPQFMGANWRLPASSTPESAIRAYGGIVSTLFTSRIFGKPFAVTEWDFTMPNPHLVEGSFLAGAYAALQGHDMLCRFNYSWTIRKRAEAESHLGFFDMVNAPLRLLSERAGALFFLRGDVAPAPAAYAIHVDPDFLESPGHRRWFPEAVGRLGLIGRTGVVFGAEGLPPDTRAVVTLGDTGARIPWPKPAVDGQTAERLFAGLARQNLLPPGAFDAGTGRFTSVTGELELRREAGTFRAVTPRSEGFVGPAGAALRGPCAEVEFVDGFGAVLVAARDGLPLAESRRVLLLHLSECRNTGMRFADEDLGILEKYGTPPPSHAEGVGAHHPAYAPGSDLVCLRFRRRAPAGRGTRRRGGRVGVHGGQLHPARPGGGL